MAAQQDIAGSKMVIFPPAKINHTEPSGGGVGQGVREGLIAASGRGIENKSYPLPRGSLF
jgi:hypothetical protein